MKQKLYIVVSLENQKSQACSTLKQVEVIIQTLWHAAVTNISYDGQPLTLEEFQKGILVIDANKIIQTKLFKIDGIGVTLGE